MKINKTNSRVTYTRPPMLTITVTLFSGQSHTFEMVPSDITVAETKIVICAGFGGTIHPCIQRLIWNGKQLEDQRTLDSYPFEAPIKIHLCLRLAGGCSWIPSIGTTFPHTILRSKFYFSKRASGQSTWNFGLASRFKMISRTLRYAVLLLKTGVK